jgi:hypothetical protein
MKAKKLIGILAMLVCMLFCIGIDHAQSYPPLPEATDALASDNAVTVVQQPIFPWFRPLYVFEPKNTTPTKGFIFYPGAFVDPRAYSPAMHKLAALGYLAAIVPMPFDMAILGSWRATRVIDSFPTIQAWAIGGHSLGGVMACSYTKDDKKGVIKGVSLWASYPSSSYSLVNKDVKVVSISGTKDGLSTPAKIDASHADLPTDTVFVPIQGGNHTQFGYYGNDETFLQPGDNPADISREVQQQAIVDAVAAFMADL